MLAGLVPGLHVNSLLPLCYFLGPEFIVSMSFSWLFFSLIPFLFLGVPSGDNFVNLHPSQKELLKGNGELVLKRSTVSMYLTCFCVLLFVPFLKLFYNIYPILEFIVPVVLLVLIIYFIKTPASLFLVLISGILGCLTFEHDVLYSLLTGFFGIPFIIFSLISPPKIPEQKSAEIRNLSVYEVFTTSFLSGVFSVFPGVSSNVVSSFLKQMNKNTDIITSTASANTAFLFYSLLTFFFLGKMRSGTAFYLGFFRTSALELVCIVLFSVSFSAFILLSFSRFWIKTQRLNRPFVLVFVLLFLVALSYCLEGLLGLVTLFSATSIGILCNLFRVPRTTLMSSLMIPVILFS